MIKNIGIVAHIDAGKTTLTEQLLYNAGYMNKIGSVDKGTTITDHLEQERARGITIKAACITFPWRNHLVNLVDTPGHLDFKGEVQRSMRVIDGAICLLDASKGVESRTVSLWSELQKQKIPTMFVINKLDKINANPQKCIDDIRNKLFDSNPFLWQSFPSFNSGSSSPFNSINQDQKERERESIKRELFKIENLEFLANRDHIFLEKFCNNCINENDIQESIKRLTEARLINPTFLTSAIRNFNILSILDGIIDYLPSPFDSSNISNSETFHSHSYHPASTSNSSPSNPLNEIKGKGGNDRKCAFAFKVMNDPQKGPLVYVRVKNGSISLNDSLYNLNSGKMERIHQIHQIHSNQYKRVNILQNGMIGALSGCKYTKTGDTLSNEQDESPLETIKFPPPIYVNSIMAASLMEQKKLEEAINILSLEDPTITIDKNLESTNLMVACQGELQMEIIKDRLIQEFNLEKLEFNQPRIIYKEAFMKPWKIDDECDLDLESFGTRLRAKLSFSIENIISLNIFSKNSNSNGNFIEYSSPSFSSSINDSSMKRGENDENSKKTNSLKRAIEDGIISALQLGKQSPHHLIGLRIKVENYEWFKESTIPSFHKCAFILTRKIIDSCSIRTQLFEPQMAAVVEIPKLYDNKLIVSDLISKRNAEIDQIQNHDDIIRIIARVSLENMLGYSNVLRQLTRGSGSFEMEPLGFIPKKRQLAIN